MTAITTRSTTEVNWRRLCQHDIRPSSTSLSVELRRIKYKDVTKGSYINPASSMNLVFFIV